MFEKKQEMVITFTLFTSNYVRSREVTNDAIERYQKAAYVYIEHVLKLASARKIVKVNYQNGTFMITCMITEKRFNKFVELMKMFKTKNYEKVIRISIYVDRKNKSVAIFAKDVVFENMFEF